MLETSSVPSLESLADESAPLKSLAPVAALEAIVQRFGRPPLVVRNQKVVLGPPTNLPAGRDAMIKGAEQWTPLVGRIEFFSHRMSWGGTGWVIDRKNGKTIIATNRHVRPLFTQQRIPLQIGPQCYKVCRTVDEHRKAETSIGNFSWKVRIVWPLATIGTRVYENRLFKG
ncbi:hypothetical protein [Sphingomonas cavernae]|uniref:Uncharacterized protein n=1 Tax=Sphingomonas cavernae TaxID=2320861 RepID=A0A418WK95_9SPHN|nr:hypothetical protein [Sphingomonas cavernae]RJF90249.1 hypothetical protein D3876_08185 [Sphingomonas cavernae]